MECVECWRGRRKLCEQVRQCTLHLHSESSLVRLPWSRAEAQLASRQIKLLELETLLCLFIFNNSIILPSRWQFNTMASLHNCPKLNYVIPHKSCQELQFPSSHWNSVQSNSLLWSQLICRVETRAAWALLIINMTQAASSHRLEFVHQAIRPQRSVHNRTSDEEKLRILPSVDGSIPPAQHIKLKPARLGARFSLPVRRGVATILLVSRGWSARQCRSPALS